MKTNFIYAFSWAIKILGSFSMLILSGITILLLGIVFGGIEPSGSTIEHVARFILTHPWVMITMLGLAIWANLLFWREKK